MLCQPKLSCECVDDVALPDEVQPLASTVVPSEVAVFFLLLSGGQPAAGREANYGEAIGPPHSPQHPTEVAECSGR